MDIPSHGNAEPDQFRQGSSNQRSFRIINQPKTVTDPGRNSENILERPAELDARDIPTRVNPKAAAAQEFLKVSRAIKIIAANNRRSRQVFSNFRCQVRPRQYTDFSTRKDIVKNLANPHPSAVLDAICTTKEHN